jgi:DNA-binding LytR/AlgR family response regulator
MTAKILIVEDNFLLAAELSELVQTELKAEPVTTSTAKAALGLIPDAIKLAFLDIEVLDGTTYPVARKLVENKIPLVFISGNDQKSMPEEFKALPFLAKPFLHANLVRLAHSLISQAN